MAKKMRKTGGKGKVVEYFPGLVQVRTTSGNPLLNPVYGMIQESGKKIALVGPDGTQGKIYASPNAFLSATANRHYLLYYCSGQYANINIKHVRRAALHDNKPQLSNRKIPPRMPEIIATPITANAIHIMHVGSTASCGEPPPPKKEKRQNKCGKAGRESRQKSKIEKGWRATHMGIIREVDIR